MNNSVGENTQSLTNYKDPQKYPPPNIVYWKDLWPLWNILQNLNSGGGSQQVKVLVYESVSALTGTITKPLGSTILIDQLPKGVTAMVSPVGANGLPTGKAAITIANVPMSVTLDTAGNYVLSLAPLGGYPVIILYYIRISLTDLAAVPLGKILEDSVVHFDQLPSNVFNFRGTLPVDSGYPTGAGSGPPGGPGGSVRMGDAYEVSDDATMSGTGVTFRRGDLIIAKRDLPDNLTPGHWIQVSVGNLPSAAVVPDEVADYNTGLKLRLRYTHQFMGLGRSIQ